MTPKHLEAVSAYYSQKLEEHGPSAKGVDWNGEASQVLRFGQLAKLFDGQDGAIDVADLGCGYGAAYSFLSQRFGDRLTYTGIDLSSSMIQSALSKHGETPKCRWIIGHQPDRKHEFAVASGIFNVRLQESSQTWQSHIMTTLDVLYQNTRCGFAVNFLTSYADKDRMRPDLFYADPGKLLDHCISNYSRHVAVLHDYELYEFTLLVRKLL